MQTSVFMVRERERERERESESIMNGGTYSDDGIRCGIDSLS